MAEQTDPPASDEAAIYPVLLVPVWRIQATVPATEEAMFGAAIGGHEQAMAFLLDEVQRALEEEARKIIVPGAPPTSYGFEISVAVAPIPQGAELGKTAFFSHFYGDPAIVARRSMIAQAQAAADLQNSKETGGQ